MTQDELYTLAHVREAARSLLALGVAGEALAPRLRALGIEPDHFRAIVAHGRELLLEAELARNAINLEGVKGV